MSLGPVLRAVEDAGRPLTALELADRTGLRVPEVRSVLDALRAAGRLAPDTGGGAGEPPGGCAAGGACGSSCTGPGECPLVIDLDLEGLRPR
ncbi:MAG: hypothetical protein KQH83_02960 [Actinobacteria bacterium]|nr:hypothetical protein [Actinomycetota bacterium]